MQESRILKELLSLSAADRIALATTLWESVADDALDLTDEHKRILNERIAVAEANPDALIPAEDVFRDLLSNR